MAERHYGELLVERNGQGLHVCIGLDTNPATVRKLYSEGLKLPTPDSHPSDADLVVAYNRRLLETGAETGLLAELKPNAAFYGMLGPDEFSTLKVTSDLAGSITPELPRKIDAKVGDIDSTNEGYVVKFFDLLGFDAITLHPTLGSDAMRPFLQRAEKGIFVLARTTNQGAGQFQDRWVSLDRSTLPSVQLYEAFAQTVLQEWNYNGNCGIVAGATFPDEARRIRRIVGPNMPLLIPGVGAQGQSAAEIVPAALRKGELGVINSSRGIIFPRRLTGEDHWESVRRSIVTLHKEIVAAQHQGA